MLRNFRSSGCASMSRGAGGKLSRTIAFRNNHRAAGRNRLGIEHQHLAERFFSRGVSTGHRRSRRHRHGCLHRQPKLAKIAAGRFRSRRRNLRRGCGHGQRKRLQRVICGGFWRRRCDLWRRLRGKLKSIGSARCHVRSRWNYDGTLQGQRWHGAMAGRCFDWSSYFWPRSRREQKRPQPALRHRLHRLGDLRNINRQHLHGMIHRHWGARDSGGRNQVGQRGILLHDERAWLNDSLPSADVVLIGHHDFLRRILRISLLRTRPPRRLRLCFLGIHRRQIFRNFVMYDRLVGRRLRQHLRLVQPCQVQPVNRKDDHRMAQKRLPG
jgi:hypothetical protein